MAAHASYNVDRDALLTAREWRPCVRVFPISPDGKVLMCYGEEETRGVWFAVGGGKEPGESDEQACHREFLEEIGVELGDVELIGPFVERFAMFHFLGEDKNLHDFMYIAHVDDDVVARTNEQHTLDLTDDEKRYFRGHEWLDIESLGEELRGAVVYPVGIGELLRRHRNGWDGSCVTMCESE